MWDSLPQWAKSLLKFLWNLFPLEIERLDDFIVRVKESKAPVEIEKINEDVIVSDQDYHAPTKIGKRFAVKIISFASNGKKIIHNAFYAFLPADFTGQIDEVKDEMLTQKLASETEKTLNILSLEKIPVKNKAT